MSFRSARFWRASDIARRSLAFSRVSISAEEMSPSGNVSRKYRSNTFGWQTRISRYHEVSSVESGGRFEALAADGNSSSRIDRAADELFAFWVRPVMIVPTCTRTSSDIDGKLGLWE